MHKCDCLVIHWWLHAIELFVMWSVAAWPLLGPVSRYPVTCAGLCGLVEGWVPVDASSGCPIIDWAVETRRWGAGWWPWWCLGGDMPHYIEIAIVLMNWLITLYCFYLFLFFTNNCCFSIKVCHVLLCMSRNTGQINPAGFQSLKYMYYTHVIMTIKWFLTLTLIPGQQGPNHGCCCCGPSCRQRSILLFNPSLDE